MRCYTEQAKLKKIRRRDRSTKEAKYVCFCFGAGYKQTDAVFASDPEKKIPVKVNIGQCGHGK